MEDDYYAWNGKYAKYDETNAEDAKKDARSSGRIVGKEF
jgi:hypothetical protein